MLQEKVLEEFLVRNHAEDGNVKCVSEMSKSEVPLSISLSENALSQSLIARLWDHISNALLDRSIVLFESLRSERGDVPGWVLVVLMTTGLVTGIWTLAAPRIDSILRGSLDSMNGIR